MVSALLLHCLSVGSIFSTPMLWDQGKEEAVGQYLKHSNTQDFSPELPCLQAKPSPQPPWRSFRDCAVMA